VFQPNVNIVIDVPKPTVKEKEDKQSDTDIEVVLAATKTDYKAKFIIIAAIVVLFVLLAAAAVKVIMGKAKLSLVGEAIKRHEAIKDIGHETPERQDLDHVLNRNASDLGLVSVVNTEDKLVQQFEEQYDPNQDFAIFATKDEKNGGFIGLREKQNLADASGTSEKSLESVTHNDKEAALKLKMSQQKLTGSSLEVPAGSSPGVGESSSPQDSLPPIAQRSRTKKSIKKTKSEATNMPSYKPQGTTEAIKLPNINVKKPKLQVDLPENQEIYEL